LKHAGCRRGFAITGTRIFVVSEIENSVNTIGIANIIVVAGTGLERGRGAKAAVVNIAVVKVTMANTVAVKVDVRNGEISRPSLMCESLHDTSNI
jgi:ABC-type glucose/galactose transport system permease subunit